MSNVIRQTYVSLSTYVNKTSIKSYNKVIVALTWHQNDSKPSVWQLMHAKMTLCTCYSGLCQMLIRAYVHSKLMFLQAFFAQNMLQNDIFEFDPRLIFFLCRCYKALWTLLIIKVYVCKHKKPNTVHNNHLLNLNTQDVFKDLYHPYLNSAVETAV